MNTILRILEVLHEKYGYYVPIKEIAYESVYFYKEEFDENIVPIEVVDHLESTIPTETSVYIDQYGTEFMVIQVQTDVQDPYEVWLVNGEVVPNFGDTCKKIREATHDKTYKKLATKLNRPTVKKDKFMIDKA